MKTVLIVALDFIGLQCAFNFFWVRRIENLENRMDAMEVKCIRSHFRGQMPTPVPTDNNIKPDESFQAQRKTTIHA